MSDTLRDLDELLAIVRKRTPGEWQFIGKEYSPRALWGSTGAMVAVPIEGDATTESRSDLQIDIHPNDQRAICTAVNNFEALAERCKRAENDLEVSARQYTAAEHRCRDLAIEVAAMTRQRDELARLRADAERWRWVRKLVADMDGYDRAVDAAIAAEKGTDQ